jgi:uncharacterized protein (TIGR02266 family)
MLVSGEIENVPLLEVLQVVAFSKQTGVLSVESALGDGAVLFDGGGIVCALSASTSALLLRAASESDPRTYLALRRVQALAALSELLALRTGTFQFKTLREPLDQVSGVPTRAFYDAGPMNAGELLLALATIVDKKDAPLPKPRAMSREQERSHPRFAPIVIPATVSLEGAELDGHLTNLSEGGTFFHGDVLPPAQSACRLRFTLPNETEPTEVEARVAWARSEGDATQRGAGLEFQTVSPEARERIGSYLTRYQKLAEEVRKTEAHTVRR